MKWFEEARGRRLVAQPVGRIDEASWEAFSTALVDAIGRAAAAGQTSVVLDLAGVDYMSSRGLRSLTIARREAEQRGLPIVLAAPNEMMREILSISRYDKIFRVVDAVDAAV